MRQKRKEHKQALHFTFTFSSGICSVHHKQPMINCVHSFAVISWKIDIRCNLESITGGDESIFKKLYHIYTYLDIIHSQPSNPTIYLPTLQARQSTFQLDCLLSNLACSADNLPSNSVGSTVYLLTRLVRQSTF